LLDLERFNLRKLSELKFRKQYQIKISDKLAAWKNLKCGKDMPRAWENLKDNMKTSAESVGLYELKQHKPWFDEECYDFQIKGIRLSALVTGSKPQQCRYSKHCKA
jgi:hypothetical protein